MTVSTDSLFDRIDTQALAGADVKAVAKDAAERAGKNAGVAPQLLYAPILWAMQDAARASADLVNANDLTEHQPKGRENRAVGESSPRTVAEVVADLARLAEVSDVAQAALDHMASLEEQLAAVRAEARAERIDLLAGFYVEHSLGLWGLWRKDLNFPERAPVCIAGLTEEEGEQFRALVRNANVEAASAS